ncbi:MAG: hypothetical protein NTV51_03895 [Verrucomicrobia bacterium]|nr:hypothetical protein [Verrucomicrobiota bacterium]
MTRLTDAELAAMEARAMWHKDGNPIAIQSVFALADDLLTVLAELKAERKRCAELRRLLKELSTSRTGSVACPVCGDGTTHSSDCDIAAALRDG